MQKRTSRQWAGTALGAITLILGLLGQFLASNRSNFMSGAHLLYYTNISNVFAIMLMALLLVYSLSAKPMPNWLSAFRFVVSAGILLTCVAFSLLLLPQMNPSYLMSIDNILVHYAVPLLTCMDFVLFDQHKPRKKGFALLGLLLPLVYFVFVLVLSFNGQRFRGSAAPYFFLDYEQNGWFTAGEGKLGVAYWFLILLALQLVLSRVLLGLKKIIQR